MATAPFGQATLGQASRENEIYSALLGKIQSRQAKVSIIGLGYVGLLLAVAFANAGYQVVGIDVDQGRTDTINRGGSQIGDVSSEALTALTSSKTIRFLNGDGSPNSKTKVGLRATTDFDTFSELDFVPLSTHHDKAMNRTHTGQNTFRHVAYKSDLPKSP